MGGKVTDEESGMLMRDYDNMSLVPPYAQDANSPDRSTCIYIFEPVFPMQRHAEKAIGSTPRFHQVSSKETKKGIGIEMDRGLVF